jgi:glycosyltransferase involved in cell wall biosynthesis
VIEKPVWHLLTGEYPPDRGGIGDYTRLLARALADHGRQVHVWTPSADADREADGVSVHAMGGVGRDALRRLGAALDRHPAPRRLLVQYAPQAWGMRGMNLPFARWLLARRRAGDDVRVMFHEPYFPFGWQRPRRNLLAAVNRVMATTLLRASTRAYVSTSAWKPLLTRLAPPGTEFITLPIPSTIPRVDAAGRVRALREELAGDRLLVVHFGTYGDGIAPLLTPALRAVVAGRPHARILLLGNGGPAFAASLASDHGLAGASIAPGYLEPGDLSLHLQAADVAIQPYPDGADTRRTTLMACIANGVPTITTRGRFTDWTWLESPLAFGDPDRPEELGGALLDRVLAGDPAALGQEHREFYRRQLSLRKSVKWLLADKDGLW